MLYTPQCVNLTMYGYYITNVTTIFIEHAEFRIYAYVACANQIWQELEKITQEFSFNTVISGFYVDRKV